MLEFLRKSTGGWFVKLLIGLIIVAFGIWGVGGMLTASQNTTLAKVGDIEISTTEFANVFDRQKRLFSNRIRQQITNTQAQAFQIDKRVLDTMVGGAALDNHAKELGLTISEEQLKQSIFSDPMFKGVNGAFSKDQFQRILSMNNLTEQAYLNEQRVGKVRNQLTKTMTGMVHIPKILSDTAYKHDHEKRTLKYFTLSEKRLPAIKDPADDVLKKYYDAHISQYKAPEYRKIKFLKISTKDLEKTIKVAPADVKAAYEKNKDSLGTPEKRQLLQLLFPGKKEAEEARKSLKSEKDFIALAKKRKVAKADYDLGEVSLKDMVDPKVAKAAFALTKGETSQAISGEFVTALVYVKNIKKAVVKTFKEAEKELTSALAAEKAKDQISTLAEKIEKDRATGANLGDIAKKLKLAFNEGVLTDREGKDQKEKKIENLDLRLINAAFQSEVGQQEDPLEIGRNSVVWFSLADIIASKNKPLKDVKKAVLKDWRQNEKLQALNKMSAKIVTELKAGTSLEKAAKKYKAKVATTKAMKRTEQDKNLSSTVLAQAYLIHKGEYSSARTNDGKGRIIFQVSKVESPEKVDDASAKRISKALVGQFQQDYLESYIAGLKDQYSVSIDRSQIARVLGQN